MKIFDARDYGIKPNSDNSVTDLLMDLIAKVNAAKNDVILSFDKGIYHVYLDGIITRIVHITNTLSENEQKVHLRNFAFLFEGMSNLTIDGNGAEFILHGNMVEMAFIDCTNIIVKNISFQYDRPSVSELEILARGINFIDIKINKTSRYDIKDGVLYWEGDNFSYPATKRNYWVNQVLDMKNNFVKRTINPFNNAIRFTEMAEGLVRVKYVVAPKLSAGSIYQLRTPERTQVGVFINKSRNVALIDCNFYYMHGLGIVGQLSDTITLERVKCAPDGINGMTTAAFADFVHMSMCKGLITIKDCYFSGSHDDVINIHGNHYAVNATIAPDNIQLAFKHKQAYGFLGIFEGNEIAFIDRDSLNEKARAIVKSSRLIDDYNTIVELTEPMAIDISNCVVENLSFIAEAHICGNYFERIPTRGILYTSRGKAIIENNTFYKTQMSAVLCSDDARYWYESGMVKDLIIRNNKIIDCGGKMPVFMIYPENRKIDSNKPVHENIVIENNLIEYGSNVLLSVKSSRRVLFVNNIVNGAHKNKKLVVIKGSSDIVFSGNKLNNCNKRINKIKSVNVKIN